jgi:hypothetical protein
MPLVALVALSLGTVARWKPHQTSACGHVATVNGPGAPPEFNLQRLTFELSGSVGEGDVRLHGRQRASASG